MAVAVVAVGVRLAGCKDEVEMAEADTVTEVAVDE